MPHRLDVLLGHYGSPLVGLVVGLEAMGLPLPGESMIIGGAVYCATTHGFSIVALIAAAAIGAILGDNAGYAIGRALGFRLLARFGRRIGLSEDRLLLGRYLFRRYGGPVVFAARFVGVLRTFASLLAGANHMPWGRFLLWNAAGGIVWTVGYGAGAFLAASTVERMHDRAALLALVIAGAVIASSLLFVKRNENRLIEQARATMARSERDAR